MNKKIKILHITEVLGGIQTHLELIFKYIDGTRFDLELILPRECELADLAREYGIKVRLLPMVHKVSLWSDFKAVFRLVRIFSSEKNAIIHLHSSKAGALGRLATLLTGPKIVFYTPHAFAYLGSRHYRRMFYLAVEKLLKFKTTYLTATTDSECQRAVSEIGYPEQRVKVIPNSVECRGVALRKNVKNSTAYLPVVTMVARICYQKNVEMFFRVAHDFLARHPKIYFQLIGAGHYESDYEELPQMLNCYDLSGKVAIKPWVKREKLLGELQKSDVVIQTSRYESFGYVLAEAAIRGVPIVGTDVDGIRDIIKDGKTGYLVQVDDDANMVKALEWVLYDQDKREYIVQNAIKHTTDSFGIERNIKKLESLYEHVSCFPESDGN